MLLLTETARVLRLVEALAVELDGFARPTAVHLPGKAIDLRSGGDARRGRRLPRGPGDAAGPSAPVREGRV